MVMGYIEPVQLQDELPSRDQPLVLAAAVCAFAVEEALVPPAARCDVSDGDEWLGPYLSVHTPSWREASLHVSHHAHHVL